MLHLYYTAYFETNGTKSQISPADIPRLATDRADALARETFPTFLSITLNFWIARRKDTPASLAKISNPFYSTTNIMADDAQSSPFIKHLASSDKSTRDQALASLRAFLSSRSDISDLDLLKLWKGLFYCKPQSSHSGPINPSSTFFCVVWEPR